MLRRALSRVKDVTQHLLFLQPSFPQNALLKGSGPALVLAVRKDHTIALPLVPGLLAAESKFEAVKSSAVTISNQGTTTLFGDGPGSQGQLRAQIDLARLFRVSKRPFKRKEQRMDSPMLLLNYASPIIRDDLNLIEGESTQRMQLIELVAKGHKGVTIFVGSSRQEADRFKTLLPASISFRSECLGQELLVPFAALQAGTRLAEEGKDCLLIMQDFNGYKAKANSLLVSQGLPNLLPDFANLVYDQTLSGRKGALTVLLGVSKQKKYLEDISYSHGVQTLGRGIQVPLRLKRPRYPGLLNQYLNKVCELNELKSQKANYGIKDQPWEEYFLLDSKWWLKGLADFRGDSQAGLAFQSFLKWNIEEDQVARWKVTACQAFEFACQVEKGLSTMGEPERRESFAKIFSLAKLEGHLHQYKQDYMPE